MAWFKCLFLTCLLLSIDAYIIEPGPVVKATKGEVWPKPQTQEKSDKYFVLRPDYFRFNADTIECQGFIQDALTRYWNIISNTNSFEKRKRLPEVQQGIKKKKFWLTDENNVGDLKMITITSAEKCTGDDVLPDLNMVENYSLTIDEKQQSLEAQTVWGVLRGLETLSQLIYLREDQLVVNVTKITDSPRFPHRGLLVDTSRHFIPVYILLQTLDAMSYNKFNVFHWHVTDDHSFPFKSISFPELSERGAFHPVSKVYEPNDVKKVIEYARLRGIRVIPEFDTPGHTRSWGVSHPELLVSCYNGSEPTGQLGPMDPTKNSTYTFVETLFKEIIERFPDKYFHVGGDEVGFECWESNPDVKTFMDNNNLTKYEELESYFINNLVKILDNLNTQYIVWEEVFTNGVVIPDTTIVHVWTDDGEKVINNVTLAGNIALYSSCWYLDHLSNGGDWNKYYTCDPYDFKPNDDQKKLVLGGEACMWSEAVNEYSISSRIWPRASATAEKLWSPEDATKDIDEAARRLEEHACRMNHRGVPAQPPNGPGVCL